MTRQYHSSPLNETLLISPSPSLTSPSPLLTSPSTPFGSWVVHKFGGTSLATAACFRNAARLVCMNDNSNTNESIKNITNTEHDKENRVWVVVSAMGEVKRSKHSSDERAEKITNLLIQCAEEAANHNQHYQHIVANIKKRHMDTATALIAPDPEEAHDPFICKMAEQAQTDVKEAIEKDFNDLEDILKKVFHNAQPHTHEQRTEEAPWWCGYGEILAAKLMVAYINFRERVRANTHTQAASATNTTPVQARAGFCDARQVIVLAVDGQKKLNYAQSTERIDTYLRSDETIRSAKIIVATGYLATSAEGSPVTLGRDGSDYSASIFAALLRAKHCTIWTDVDGIYSANPQQVKEAVIVDALSYDEASELAFFGAKVIHPKTMTPVVLHEVPIYIRNSFNVAHPGSCIVSARILAEKNKGNHINSVIGGRLRMSFGVKGVSDIRNLALLKVEGTGMIGVPGVAHRLFGALHACTSNVIIITQGGSEHSICFAVPMAQGEQSLMAVKHEFREELELGEIATVDLRGPIACLAIVGDGMRETCGVAGRFFSALGDANINIIAIAQGSSERNISALINQADVDYALQIVHRAFLRKLSNLESVNALSA